MSDSLFDLVGVLPIEIIVTYVCTKVLRIPRVGLYWAVRMTATVAMVLVRNDMNPVPRMMLGLFSYFLIPFLFSKGRASQRLLILFVMYVLLMISELVSTGFWFLMTGLPIADIGISRAHMPEYVLLRLFHLMVSVILFAILYALVKRRAGGEGAVSLGAFIGFPVVQTLLLSFVLMVKLYLAPGSDALYIAVCLCTGVFLVSDVALFLALDRYQRKQMDDQRALALQDQLDAYLERYEAVMREMEQVAQLRHDVRNQLQVASVLAERGDLEQAKAHVDAMMAWESAAASARDGGAR